MPGDAQADADPRAGLRPAGVAWFVVTLAGVVAVAIVAVVWATDRSGGDVCPAVGYSSTLDVVLTGDTAAVEHLQVCRDGRCEPPPPGGAGASAEPLTPVERDGDTWTFTLFSSPDTVELRALDGGGGVLATTQEDVRWRQVGGTDRCGGPQAARVGWSLDAAQIIDRRDATALDDRPTGLIASVQPDAVVLGDEARRTFDDGFVGLWLPRGVDATLTVEHDGDTATADVSTRGTDDPTCLTGLRLT